MASETVERTAEQKAADLVALQNAIMAGVTSGDLTVEQDEVTAKIEGKGEVKREYTRYTAATMKGALILSEGKQADVLKDFNYAYDLGVRSRERQALLAANEGPEKAIEKGVKGFMAAFGVSETEARAEVIKQRKERGLPV